MSDTGAFVYVVDDDVSAREGVARLIRSAGLMAKTFSSGEEFLAAPRPNLPSCLVLDMNLPGLTGLDLQQELARSGQRVPIIFLTGHGDISMSVRALKAGAADFLTKPFDDEDLLNAIRAMSHFRSGGGDPTRSKHRKHGGRESGSEGCSEGDPGSGPDRCRCTHPRGNGHWQGIGGARHP